MRISDWSSDVCSSDLEKAVRNRITDAMISQIETHNNDRSESENAMNSLTLRASSGTRATLSLSEDHEIAAEEEVPRAFCAPCTNLIGDENTSAKEVPAVKTKRNALLRLNTT